MPEYARHGNQKCSWCACNTFGLMFVALLHRKRCSWILSIVSEWVSEGNLLDIMLFHFHNYSVPRSSSSFALSVPLNSQFHFTAQLSIHPPLANVYVCVCVEKKNEILLSTAISVAKWFCCGINVVLVCCGECSRLNGWASCAVERCRSFESTAFIQQNLFAFECGRNILYKSIIIFYLVTYSFGVLCVCVSTLRHDITSINRLFHRHLADHSMCTQCTVHVQCVW